MLNRVIDKTMAAGEWIGRDMRRVHGLMSLFDLLAVALISVFLMEVVAAVTADPPHPQALSLMRGKARWMLAALCIPFGHLALTSLGQRWIKRSAASYSIAFVVLAVGGALAGTIASEYARSAAIASGYRSCDRSFADDLKRTAERLVAPGVLCPPASHQAKPYPPPG